MREWPASLEPTPNPALTILSNWCLVAGISLVNFVEPEQVMKYLAKSSNKDRSEPLHL